MLLKISREKKCGTIARRLKVIRGASWRGVPGHDGETYNAKTFGESLRRHEALFMKGIGNGKVYKRSTHSK